MNYMGFKTFNGGLEVLPPSRKVINELFVAQFVKGGVALWMRCEAGEIIIKLTIGRVRIRFIRFKVDGINFKGKSTGCVILGGVVWRDDLDAMFGSA